MNAMNCKVGMRITTNGKDPKRMDRIDSDTCSQEDEYGYLKVIEVRIRSGDVTVGGHGNTVTFRIEDIEPLFENMKYERGLLI
jgi:hypothetical protein